MKPTIYLDIDDPFLNQGYVNIFPNKHYEFKGIKFDTFEGDNNTVGKIHLSDIAVSLIENYTDKYQWVLICPYHIFDIADEYTINKLNELNIFILDNDYENSIAGIKFATNTLNIVNDIRSCKILFNEYLQIEHIYDITNEQNTYAVDTLNNLYKLLDFFANNKEFISEN